MSILQSLTSPWAISPAVYEQMWDIYGAHTRGEKADIGAIEARMGRPLENQRPPIEVRNGVAIIPIEGVMSKRMNMFQQISGGTSTQMIGQDLDAAIADPKVHSIILAIDSPGGSVDGLDPLTQKVRDAAKVKPVRTLADGMMVSAAYQVGAAAGPGNVFLSDTRSMIGQIGVVMKHVDVSAAEEKQGVKTTEVYAGKFKRIDSSYAPLSKEGKAYLQEMVDEHYSLFVGSVAHDRGVSQDQALAMADGRIFTGQQAVDAGLVDGVITLDGLVEQLASQASTKRAPAQTIKQGTTMTLDELKQSSPDLIKQIQAEAATAERDRILAVKGAGLPGHEGLIEAMMFDGKSTAADAALAVITAERGHRSQHSKDSKDEAPNGVPMGASSNPNPGATKEKTREEQAREASAYAAEHKVSFLDACAALNIRSA